MDRDLTAILVEEISIPIYFEKYIEPVVRPPRMMRIGQGRPVLCPFHNETDPSMHYYESKGKKLYKCFGCNASGNIVMLHIQKRIKYDNVRLSYMEAMGELIDLFQLTHVKELYEELKQKGKISSAGVVHKIKPLIDSGKIRETHDSIINDETMTMDDKIRKLGRLDTIAAIAIKSENEDVFNG